MLNFIDITQQVEKMLRRKGGRERSLIQFWINEAQRRACRSYPFTFLEKEASTPSTTDTPNYYKLPDDFRGPIGVRFKDVNGTKSLPVFPIHSVDANITNLEAQEDSPSRATFSGNLLLLTPGTNNANGTILLRYYRAPLDMRNDADIPIIPAGMREVLTWGAIHVGSRWIWTDKGEQDRAKQEFLESVQALIQSDQGDQDHTESMGFDSGRLDQYIEAGT